MRAINARPALVRRYSNSMTSSSNFALGSYRLVNLNPAATPAKDIVFKNSRRVRQLIADLQERNRTLSRSAVEQKSSRDGRDEVSEIHCIRRWLSPGRLESAGSER